MRKLFALLLALPLMCVPLRAGAVLGVGDLSFDPTVYGEISALYKQTVDLYKTAKEQLDGLVKIERTINDAKAAYDMLANTDIKRMFARILPDFSDAKSFAALRSEIARAEGEGIYAKEFVQFQHSRLAQLERLVLLKKATNKNLEDSAGRMSGAKAENITAQSTAALAALAATEQQRALEEELARTRDAKAIQDELRNAGRVYEAIGKTD